MLDLHNDLFDHVRVKERYLAILEATEDMQEIFKQRDKYLPFLKGWKPIDTQENEIREFAMQVWSAVVIQIHHFDRHNPIAVLKQVTVVTEVYFMSYI